jgi:hypothetical protein
MVKYTQLKVKWKNNVEGIVSKNTITMFSEQTPSRAETN